MLCHDLLPGLYFVQSGRNKSTRDKFFFSLNRFATQDMRYIYQLPNAVFTAQRSQGHDAEGSRFPARPASIRWGGQIKTFSSIMMCKGVQLLLTAFPKSQHPKGP